MITQLICQLTPAVLAVMIYEKQKKVKLSGREFLCCYIIMVGAINLCAALALNILSSHAEHLVTETLFTVSVTWKYLLAAFAASVVIPVVYTLAAQIISIELTVEKEEKEEQSR